MEILAKHTPDSKIHVMVVDDNPEELNFYNKSLSDHFVTTSAQNVKQAWDLLNMHQYPDAIVVDTSSQNEESTSFCKKLRNSRYMENIPVLFISDDNESSLKSQVFEIGGDDFIVKPAAMNELIARVKHHATQYRKTKRLESLIFIDPLTHLPNAAKFESVLKQEWSRCARYWHHISMLLIRVEKMQEFKNNYGKDEYYALTASIAVGLAGIGTRAGDVFASLGNDCFGLLLSDCSIEGARIKAEQILAKFNDPNFAINQQLNAHKIDCTITFAVAAPAGGSSSSKLYNAVENLLFKARNENRKGIIQLDHIIGVDGAEFR